MRSTKDKRHLEQEKGELRREFMQYYESHRCLGAPPGGRVFGFCWTLYETRFARRFSPQEFLGALYETLDGRPGRGRGLLNDFELSKYHGGVPAANHFINMLAYRLIVRLQRWRRRLSDRGKSPKRPGFLHRPELGLCRGVARRTAVPGADGPDLPDLPHPDGPPGQTVDDSGEGLTEALAALSPSQYEIILLWYWGGLSARAIGGAVGVDHKTVRRRHDWALNRLRASFVDEARAAAA
jgi:DNA-directed RNA polymerase specialized sigma24 family protein